MINIKKRDKNDIYGIPVLNLFFKNRVVVRTIQVLTLVLFVYGVFLGFKEPGLENTFTRYLFWGLFWSLFMVVTLSTFGRIFCGICPHGFIGKYITKFGFKKELPKFLQNRYIGIMILVVGWWFIYYSFPSFWKSPGNTSIMFTVLTILAILIFYFYKDMSYCKFICPIGTLTRAFNKVSFTFLSTYKEDCKECKTFDCAKACSYNLKPFTFEKKNSMEDCSLCMDCSSACEAVNFKITKPSNSLFDKFKTNSAEVWTYILIVACIPITMSFHHGLNRTNIADQFIWSKTANFFTQTFNLGFLDVVGMFSFFYALIFTVGITYIGMYIASKLLNSDLNKTLYTLGYAFIPIFIIGGLAHLLHSFFTHTYADIANGFLYGFGIEGVKVANLASRNASWLNIFNFFPYLAVLWGYLILAKRLKFFDASKGKKVLAFIFASSLITFYLLLNFYRAYVFATYGVKQGGHNHASHASSKMFQSVSLKDAKILQTGENRTSGAVCGMNLPKFYKTNHSATLNGKVKQYCSIHCLSEDLKINNLPLENIQVVDVTSLDFIDATKAFYIVGSSKKGTMTGISKYAFKDKEQALGFQKKFGGELKTFDETVQIALKDFKREEL